MLKEFKDFAIKGNMIDMAVGIIIGGAFGTIVKSLVDDVLMPVISGLFLTLNRESYATLTAAQEAGAPVLAYGQFINNVLSFLIGALAFFFLVKGINSLKKKEEAKPSEPTELDVLKDIKTLLKKK